MRGTRLREERATPTRARRVHDLSDTEFFEAFEFKANLFTLYKFQSEQYPNNTS